MTLEEKLTKIKNLEKRINKDNKEIEKLKSEVQKEIKDLSGMEIQEKKDDYFRQLKESIDKQPKKEYIPMPYPVPYIIPTPRPYDWGRPFISDISPYTQPFTNPIRPNYLQGSVGKLSDNVISYTILN